jgi:hypothetical protein
MEENLPQRYRSLSRPQIEIERERRSDRQTDIRDFHNRCFFLVVKESLKINFKCYNFWYFCNFNSGNRVLDQIAKFMTHRPIDTRWFCTLSPSASAVRLGPIVMKMIIHSNSSQSFLFSCCQIYLLEIWEKGQVRLLTELTHIVLTSAKFLVNRKSCC